MPETDLIRQALDREFPARGDVPDWEDVLHRAAARPPVRRRWPFHVAAVAAVVAAAAVLVAAPWNDTTERVGILERALAAVGDGPVLHLVLRDERRATLVDLETGERRPIYRESEMWIDPQRGFSAISRIEGVADGRTVASPSEIEAPFAITASNYREALEAGRARVRGSGVVDGIPVHWITVIENEREDRELQVGVSKETYKPVYMREILGGEPVADTGVRVLVAEQLSTGSGDFSPTNRPHGPEFHFEASPEPLTRAEASGLLDGRAVWLGEEFSGLHLAGIRKLTLWSDPVGGKWTEEQTGIRLVYAASITSEGIPDGEGPAIIVEQGPRPHPNLTRGLGRYVVPEGHAALTPRPGAAARVSFEGTYVSVLVLAGKRSDDIALAAARALRPLSAGNDAGG